MAAFLFSSHPKKGKWIPTTDTRLWSWYIFSPLALGRYLYPGQRPRWGWEVSRLLAQSSETVYQPLCEPQLSPLWSSLDIWRPTCLADRQRVWGLFMTRSTDYKSTHHHHNELVTLPSVLWHCW